MTGNTKHLMIKKYEHAAKILHGVRESLERRAGKSNPKHEAPSEP